MTTDNESKEFYEERAAIREYDGGMTRPEAEKAAMAEATERQRRLALPKTNRNLFEGGRR